MDGKNPAKEIPDIRALLSMDPDHPEFKAAWRHFQKKNGAGGLITSRAIRSREKVELMLCSELLVDILKGCRQVSTDDKATPAERNKAAELAVMVSKGHEKILDRLAGIDEWVKKSKVAKDYLEPQKENGEQSQEPRFYQQKSGE